jgi:predicted transcriptional regulator
MDDSDPLAYEILSVLVDQRSANDARQVYAAIVARHPIAYRAITTTLTHLVRSGTLSTRTLRRHGERRRYRVVCHQVRCATA